MSPTEEDFKLNTLKNGIRHVHLKCEDERFVLGLIVFAGSNQDPSNRPGLAHFLEHMMFRGSDSFPSSYNLASAMEKFGGEWNAATSPEHTEYWYSGVSENQDLVIELFFEFFQNPTLKGIAKEKEIIQRELEAEKNEFSEFIDPDYHKDKLLYQGTPLANSIIGTEQSIQEISTSDIKSFRNSFYQPENIILYTVSNAENTINTTAKHFENYLIDSEERQVAIKPVVPDPFSSGPMLKHIPNTDNQYTLQFSYCSCGEWHEDALGVEVLSRLLCDGLSSPIVSQLRENLGLAYDIEMEGSFYSEAGSIDLSATILKEHIPTFTREVFKILSKLVSEGPFANDLARAVNLAKVDYTLMKNDFATKAYRLAWATGKNRPWSLKQIIQDLGCLKPSDLQSLAKKYFQPSRLVVILLGPSDKPLERSLKKILENHSNSPHQA